MPHPNDVLRDRFEREAKLFIEDVLQSQVDVSGGPRRHRPLLPVSMRSDLSDTELDELIHRTGETAHRMVDRSWAEATARTRVRRKSDGTLERDAEGHLLYDRWRHLTDFMASPDRLDFEALRAYLARTAACKVNDIFTQHSLGWDENRQDGPGANETTYGDEASRRAAWLPEDELEFRARDREELAELAAERARERMLDATIARILAWADEQPWIERAEHREILVGQLSGRGHAELARELGTPGPAGANRVLKKFRRSIEPNLPPEARRVVEEAHRRSRDTNRPGS